MHATFNVPSKFMCGLVHTYFNIFERNFASILYQKQKQVKWGNAFLQFLFFFCVFFLNLFYLSQKIRRKKNPSVISFYNLFSCLMHRYVYCLCMYRAKFGDANIKSFKYKIKKKLESIK